MFARRLMPWLGEMLIATASAASIHDKDALTRCRQIGDRLSRLIVQGQRAHGHLQYQIFAGVPRAVRAFAVAPPIGPELAIVAVTQQRVVVRIGFEMDAAAIPTVSARGPAARNVFLAAKRHAPVAAVPGLHVNSGFVNKHLRKTPHPWGPEFIPPASAPDRCHPEAVLFAAEGSQSVRGTSTVEIQVSTGSIIAS